MSGRGGYGRSDRVREERRDAGDQALQDGIAAAARSAVDTVLCLASVRNVKWEDALAEFPPAYERAMNDLLDRLEKSRERKGGR